MIETYQIRNVLRVYSTQLKKKAATIRDSAEPLQPAHDIIDISIKARRKQMLNQISDHLISQITSRKDQQNASKNIEKNELPFNVSGDWSNHETE
ncbi:MAG: hypothetical protein JW932_15180 [Deltaproteobacteria bacterium]|nr:hypothetical protein [Deltaproteobacteria bacterium]